jgi:phage baseplate assembly protein V
MRETLQRLLTPIWRRLRLIVSRGVVSRTDDTRLLQVVQVDLLAGETAGMERFQEYGFSSRPLVGAEAIAVAVGGARGHLVAVAVDDRRHRRGTQEPGEVCLYTDEGDAIRLRRGRVIEVIAGAKVHVTAPEVVADCGTAAVNATASVTLDTPETQITGDVQIGGNLTVVGAITGQGGMAVSGGSGASVQGDLVVTGGDVTADGIGLKPHTHIDSTGGETGAAQ